MSAPVKSDGLRMALEFLYRQARTLDTTRDVVLMVRRDGRAELAYIGSGGQYEQIMRLDRAEDGEWTIQPLRVDKP